MGRRAYQPADALIATSGRTRTRAPRRGLGTRSVRGRRRRHAGLDRDADRIGAGGVEADRRGHDDPGAGQGDVVGHRQPDRAAPAPAGRPRAGGVGVAEPVGAEVDRGGGVVAAALPAAGEGGAAGGGQVAAIVVAEADLVERIAELLGLDQGVGRAR